MKHTRKVLLALAAIAVSACSGPQTASRNVMDVQPGGAPLTGTVSRAPVQTVVRAPVQSALQQLDVKVDRVTVSVPRSLKVSEKNTRYPNADIVWRGDSMGDRYDQIQAILTESANRAAAKVNGTRPAHVHIQLTRFHGVTEKTRYSTGGVHNVNFLITVYDAVTGQVLRPTREVVSNLDAFGGAEAIAADKRGETQKVRVTGFLSHVIQDELTRPGGYVDNNSGFFVALNKS